MSTYYTRTKSFTAGSVAKGADVKAELDAIDAGFALVEDDFNNLSAIQQAVTDAETAQYWAEQWATKAEDSIVDAGKYSAYHWAQKAEDSATEAATFDPSSYYTKVAIDAGWYTASETDALLDTKVDISVPKTVSDNYEASNGDVLILPALKPIKFAAAPTVGDTVIVTPSEDWYTDGAPTIDPQGKPFRGVSGTLSLNLVAMWRFTYVDATYGWSF